MQKDSQCAEDYNKDVQGSSIVDLTPEEKNCPSQAKKKFGESYNLLPRNDFVLIMETGMGLLWTKLSVNVLRCMLES